MEAELSLFCGGDCRVALLEFIPQDRDRLRVGLHLQLLTGDDARESGKDFVHVGALCRRDVATKPQIGK